MNKRLVWTSALTEGFRPSGGDFPFTAILTFEPKDGGTRYHVIGRHGSVEVRKKHEGMGFHEGWGKALDQLVAYMKSVSIQ